MAEAASATAGYRLHHTMIRVRDPAASREFYEKKMGMRYGNMHAMWLWLSISSVIFRF
jgi:hypothetical protein